MKFLTFKKYTNDLDNIYEVGIKIQIPNRIAIRRFVSDHFTPKGRALKRRFENKTKAVAAKLKERDMGRDVLLAKAAAEWEAKEKEWVAKEKRSRQ